MYTFDNSMSHHNRPPDGSTLYCYHLKKMEKRPHYAKYIFHERSCCCPAKYTDRIASPKRKSNHPYGKRNMGTIFFVNLSILFRSSQKNVTNECMTKLIHTLSQANAARFCLAHAHEPDFMAQKESLK